MLRMKNQMIFQIDRLKLHMYFVFDALYIDYLILICLLITFLKLMIDDS